MKGKAWRAFYGFGIVYIALIGIFAIEELQRRHKLETLVAERQAEANAALAALGTATDEATVARRASLEEERNKLAGIHARLVALIVVGPVDHTPSATLKGLSCEFAATRDPSLRCAEVVPDSHSPREIAATIALKRTSEGRSSGDVFAVLIIVAAVGGALIRLYLPKKDDDDAFRTVFRAIGGGIVCFLVISGGSLQLPGVSTTALTNPATGALCGLLSGMFSTKVFEFLSRWVDSWFEKLLPKKDSTAQDQAPEPVGDEPSTPAE